MLEVVLDFVSLHLLVELEVEPAEVCPVEVPDLIADGHELKFLLWSVLLLVVRDL